MKTATIGYQCPVCGIRVETQTQDTRCACGAILHVTATGQIEIANHNQSGYDPDSMRGHVIA